MAFFSDATDCRFGQNNVAHDSISNSGLDWDWRPCPLVPPSRESAFSVIYCRLKHAYWSISFFFEYPQRHLCFQRTGRVGIRYRVKASSLSVSLGIIRNLLWDGSCYACKRETNVMDLISFAKRLRDWAWLGGNTATTILLLAICTMDMARRNLTRQTSSLPKRFHAVFIYIYRGAKEWERYIGHWWFPAFIFLQHVTCLSHIHRYLSASVVQRRRDRRAVVLLIILGFFRLVDTPVWNFDQAAFFAFTEGNRESREERQRLRTS